ncbi:MAG: DUF5693 family protein [Elusimicrobiota bacterium]
MKKFSKIVLFYTSFLLLLFGFLLAPLKNRICNQKNNAVALAVEYDDIANFFGIEKLKDFKAAGINTVVISDEKAVDFFVESNWNPEFKKFPQEKYLGISSEKISIASKLNLDIVFSIQGDISLIPPPTYVANNHTFDIETRNITTHIKIPNILAVILTDGFYGKIPTGLDYTFGIVEFAKQKEVKKILKNSTYGYKVFKLKWDSDYKKNLDKINRAVVERNTGIIILDLSQTTFEYAIEYIRESKKNLENARFFVGRPKPIKEINHVLLKHITFTKILSLLIALISPVICLLFLYFFTPAYQIPSSKENLSIHQSQSDECEKSTPLPVLSQLKSDLLESNKIRNGSYCIFGENFFVIKTISVFLIMTVFSILSGATISSLLSTKDFMLSSEVFRGVKIAFLLPIVGLIYLLYKDNLKDFLKKPILRSEAIFIGILLFVIGFYIVRTGNYGLTTFFEDNLRLFLEKIFFVRPRFKEFLIGHPFIILAVYLKCKENNFLWKPFFIVGIVGQISIINTFCHIHTPFFISLLRSFNGLCIGVIFGIILIYLYNKCVQKNKSQISTNSVG